MRKMWMRSILFGSVFAIGLLTVPQARAQGTETVRQAQQALKDKGFDPGPIDGVNGRKTRSATKAFQKQQNLNADGHLGPQTLDGLGVKQGSAGTEFHKAGTNLKTSYKTGGKDIGHGSKELGSDVKHGDVVDGAKDFGKGVGHGVAKMGVGTGHAAKNTAKGVKRAVTGNKTDENK